MTESTHTYTDPPILVGFLAARIEGGNVATAGRLHPDWLDARIEMWDAQVSIPGTRPDDWGVYAVSAITPAQIRTAHPTTTANSAATLIEKGEFMADENEDLAAVTPLARLGERLVIVLPGDALYSPDGPVLPGSDWDPELFRTKADAKRTLDRLAEDAENIGLTGWTARICRLDEVGAVSVPALATETAALDVAAFNASAPAPEPDRWREYAVLTPGGPYREYETGLGHQPFVTNNLDYATERAADVTDDWARRLGVPDHRAVVVARTIMTVTGPWEPLE